MELMRLLDEMRRRAPEQEWTLAGSRSPQWLRSLALDSREVEAGDLFFCVPGLNSDGHEYAEDAVAQGAAAVVVERPLGLPVPEIRVRSVRRAMAILAAAFHGDPSQQMALVGVTGTNGKTTITQLLQHIMASAGGSAASIGTLSGARTTPEAIHLQRQLRDLQRDGVDTVAMEVSSHALAQHRVDGTWFQVAIFTNLSPDHLDYHGDMESYFQAKAELFLPERAGAAVINTDDPYGARLAQQVEPTMPVAEYNRAMATNLTPSITGSTFVWRGQQVHFPVPGLFNVDNALAAAEAAVLLGISPEAVAKGLATVPPVAGRFEVVHTNTPTVIVDYAHTPDGLEQLLASVREVGPDADVIVVFGAGGDRDRPKRPLMGEIAQRLANRVVVTSDNPRSEDPDAIIDEILAGMTKPGDAVVEPDRRLAIAQALTMAGPKSVVLVAGKGHETTQTIGDNVLPFDDREVVRTLLGGGA